MYVTHLEGADRSYSTGEQHPVLAADDEADSKNRGLPVFEVVLKPANSACVEIGRCRTCIRWVDLFNRARVFGVSLQGIVHRCRALGIINDFRCCCL